MGLWSRFTEYFRRPEPNPNRVSRAVETDLPGRPLPTAHDYKRFADEGYRRNVVVYACVRFWASTVSQVSLVAKRGDPFGEADPLASEHPLSRLLRRPNPEQSQPAYLRQLLTFLLVMGNSYSHKVRPRAKTMPPVELWQLRPDRTRAIPDEDGFVVGYEFPSDMPTRGTVIPCEDISHLKLEDPINDYYGFPPIAALARQGDIDNEAADFIRSVFMNAGMPAALLKVSSDTPVTPEQIEAAEQRFADKFAKSPSNVTKTGRGRVAVIARDVELLSTGALFKDLLPAEIFGHTESRICAAFGVPPILIGVKTGLEHSTYANYKEALRDFWSDSAAPMWQHIADEWSWAIAREFGEDHFIEADVGEVDALKEDREQRATRGIAGWKEGILTLDEARDHLDMPPDESGVGEMRVFDLKPQAPNPFDQGGGSMPEEDEDEEEDITAEEMSISKRRIDTLSLPVDKIPKEPIWRKLHRAADKEAPKLERGVIRAVEGAQDAVSVKELTEALSARDEPRAEQHLQRAWKEGAIPEIQKTLVPSLASLHQEGAGAGAAEIPERFAAQPPAETFASVDPGDSSQFAETLIAELVTQVDEGTQAMIRQTVEKMFSEGISPRLAATRIRAMLGLTKPQAAAIVNLEAKLVKDGLAGDALEAALVKKAKEFIRQRAILIARTEGLRAVSEGQNAMWEAAVGEGILEPSQERFWITTDDDRACPICIPMDGQVVGLKEKFTGGNGEVISFPPIHPACRCAVGLV